MVVPFRIDQNYLRAVVNSIVFALQRHFVISHVNLSSETSNQMFVAGYTNKIRIEIGHILGKLFHRVALSI